MKLTNRKKRIIIDISKIKRAYYEKLRRKQVLLLLLSKQRFILQGTLKVDALFFQVS